jgi:hypothetical protein
MRPLLGAAVASSGVCGRDLQVEGRPQNGGSRPATYLYLGEAMHGRRELPGCLDPKRLAEGISVETGQPGVDHAQRGRHNSDLWREPIASALAPVAPSKRRASLVPLSPLGVAYLAVRSATVHRAALHCLSAQEGAVSSLALVAVGWCCSLESGFVSLASSHSPSPFSSPSRSLSLPQ